MGGDGPWEDANAIVPPTVRGHYRVNLVLEGTRDRLYKGEPALIEGRADLNVARLIRISYLLM